MLIVWLTGVEWASAHPEMSHGGVAEGERGIVTLVTYVQMKCSATLGPLQVTLTQSHWF